MTKAAKCIYFFNDMMFALEDMFTGKIPEELKQEELKLFWNMTERFVSDKVVPLESDLVMFNLKQNIQALQNKEYDLAVILGQKGNTLFNKIYSDIHVRNKKLLTIKRYFKNETLNDMEMDFTTNHKEAEEIKHFLNESKGLEILFIDDIVFSGGTIKKAKEILDIRSQEVDIITMIALEEAMRVKENHTYAGIYINDNAWPAAQSDLWCFRDLIEDDAVPLRNGKAASFLYQEEFSRQFMFGKHHEAVVRMTELFMEQIKEMKRKKYGDIG